MTDRQRSQAFWADEILESVPGRCMKFLQSLLIFFRIC
jgi:hypothetical protein